MAHKHAQAGFTHVRGVLYAIINTQLQTCSEGEKKVRTVPNTFNDTTKLPEAAFWKEAEDKEIASLIKPQAFGLVPITSILARSKIIGSRWVYKIKADNAHKAMLTWLGDDSMSSLWKCFRPGKSS